MKYFNSLYVPDVYYFDFDKPNLNKPWVEDPKTMGDYFNHGFTEETFKIYQKKI